VVDLQRQLSDLCGKHLLLVEQMLSSPPMITTTNDSNHWAHQELQQQEGYLSSSLVLAVHLRTPLIHLCLAANFELMLNMA
jgi:hypothetical protein